MVGAYDFLLSNFFFFIYVDVMLRRVTLWEKDGLSVGAALSKNKVSYLRRQDRKTCSLKWFLSAHRLEFNFQTFVRNPLSPSLFVIH